LEGLQNMNGKQWILRVFVILFLMSFGLAQHAPLASGQEPVYEYPEASAQVAALDGELLTPNSVAPVEVEATPGVIALATIRYVAPGGNCGGPAPCYSHPQGAFDAAQNGDEIRIQQGVYSRIDLSHVEVAKTHDKVLTVRGGFCADWSYNPSVCQSIIDGTDQVRVLAFSGPTANIAIEDLVIRNGRTLAAEVDPNLGPIVGYGGGIGIYQARLTVRNTIFQNNFALGGGGAILITQSQGTGVIENNRFLGNTVRDHQGGAILISHTFEPYNITDNQFSGNTSRLGGAIGINNAEAHLSGNTIQMNYAREQGGGLWLYQWRGDLFVPYTANFDHNLIRHNQAATGGGIYLEGCQTALLHANAVIDNQATTGAGIYFDIPSFFAPDARNNTVAGNHGPQAVYIRTNNPDPSAWNSNLISHEDTGLFFEASGTKPALTGSNNLIWASPNFSDPTWVNWSGTVSANPLLREDTLHLQAGSPARTIATSYTGLDIDGQGYGGSGAGADEFNASDTLLLPIRDIFLPIVFKN
jgi:hypothetical protein